MCRFLIENVEPLTRVVLGDKYRLNIGDAAGDRMSSYDYTSTHGGTSERGDESEVAYDTAYLLDDQPDPRSLKMLEGKTKRLVEFNVDSMIKLLKQIVARRNAVKLVQSQTTTPPPPPSQPQDTVISDDMRTIDEVKEIIELPKYDLAVLLNQEDPNTVILSIDVTAQLYDYVSNVSAMYNENPFHNFEHASHVTMSVVKLLSRIVAPSDIDVDKSVTQTAQTLHDHTYGITSDPLTQFACVFR